MKKGKHILITGGTGSFGSTVVAKYMKKKDVSHVTVFSRDEDKQHAMRQKYGNDPKLHFVIGDIRERDSLRHAMYGVDYVFHAAALKHVPVGEFFPLEAVQTNILGTHNLLDAADIAGVTKLVLLSTDKSVHPINAMGMTKAIAEKLLVARSRTSRKTIFCAVRYGNVAASRGSVIPLFVERIKAGAPLPITVPHMTRFLLTLEDAVSLVELAIEKGEQGDIFVRKSPASTIQDLAEVLIDIFDSKSKIDVVGIREGEKMHEILAHSMELQRAEDLKTHFRIRPNGVSFQKFVETAGINLNAAKDYSSETTERLTKPQLKNLLLSIPYIKKQLGSEQS
ncbi:MAG: polysaccharide biosynthesis protein [bacterium]|nr:polysaccharide biosynthesis protein [bacterium]